MNLTFKHGIFFSILIGILIFLYFFDVSVLSPTNIEWILKDSGDLLQHQLGSFAFRNDSWHFPITKTTNINYPEGISIVYTDSNLFMSMVSKLLKSVFSPELQFWGIWYLMCWILQALFGYLIVHHLSKDVIYSLLATILFSLLPTIYYRIGHSNLIAHWLILAGIFVFINDEKDHKKIIKFWLLMLFTPMIHAYLVFMIMSIFGIWVIQKLIKEYQSKQFNFKNLYLNIGFGIGFILWMWTLGYFYNQPSNSGSLGFGYYSMNINAIFNPFGDNWSAFFPVLRAGGGQYEGFQFLGTGILLLFLIFNIKYFIDAKFYQSKKLGIFTAIYIILTLVFFLYLKNIEVIEREFRLEIIDAVLLFIFILNITLLINYIKNKTDIHYRHLLIPAFICLFIALSSDITIGDARLLKIEFPKVFDKIFQLIRSSGRFYWVTNLIFMTFLFSYFTQLNWKKPFLKYMLLVILIFIQLVDMQDIDMSLGANKKHLLNEDETLKKLIANTEHVQFINFFDMPLTRQILFGKNTVNDFYMAHNRGQLSNKRYEQQMNDFKNGHLSENNLYLFKKLGDLSPNQKHHVYSLQNEFLATSKEIINNVKRNTFQYDVISLKELCNRIETNKLVVVAVQDEGSVSLNKNFAKSFDSTFNCHLSNLGYRHSYLAIFVNGKLVQEKIDSKNAVEYQDTLESYQIKVKSAGNEHGNVANIHINGFDYSLKERGLNCVSVEKTDDLIHSFSFDTFDKNYPF